MDRWTLRPELSAPETSELLKARASARGERVVWDYSVAERLVSRRFLRAAGAIRRAAPSLPAYEITREGRQAISSLA